MIEWRQHRRAEIQAQVDVWGLETAKPSQHYTGRSKNVSLNGVYAIMPSSFPFQVGSAISCAVNVPPAVTKQFPFSRLLGSGRVVRIAPVDGRATTKQAEVGVAIAFAGNVTTLGTIGTV